MLSLNVGSQVLPGGSIGKCSHMEWAREGYWYVGKYNYPPPPPTTYIQFVNLKVSGMDSLFLYHWWPLGWEWFPQPVLFRGGQCSRVCQPSELLVV